MNHSFSIEDVQAEALRLIRLSRCHYANSIANKPAFEASQTRKYEINCFWEHESNLEILP